MGRNKTVEDEEVLAAARDVFRREGHAASTRDVARAAGVSQAVLYQRFGSKEELFFRAMAPEPLDVEALLGPYPSTDARRSVLSLGKRLLEYLRGFAPTFLNVVAAHGAEVERLRAWHDGLPFFPMMRAIASRFERLAADGLVSPGNAHSRAMVLISTVHSQAMFELLTGPDHPARGKQNIDQLLRVLWDGLAPEADRRSARPR
jgi:AcrR family transcriptional regulator